MSKVQTSPREELRQGIRELWSASYSGTRLDKQKAVKKIKNAVEREERIMLNKIQVEETDELDDLDLVEQLEVVEALAAGEPVANEAPVTEVVQVEEPKKRRSYNRRKVEPLGVTEEKPKRDSRRNKAPNDDGGGHPLALNGNGLGSNGHVNLSPAQASKLWEIITGGQMGFQIQDGQVTCWVSESSFKKALPALIDRL